MQNQVTPPDTPQVNMPVSDVERRAGDVVTDTPGCRLRRGVERATPDSDLAAPLAQARYAPPSPQVDPKRAFAYNLYSTVNAYPTAASESTALFTLWRCAPIDHPVGGRRFCWPFTFLRFNPTTSGKRRHQLIVLTRPRPNASPARFFLHFFRWFGGFYGEV